MGRKAMIMAAIAAMAVGLEGMPMAEQRTPHWKELQSEEERKEMLAKAEEKRKRKRLAKEARLKK